MMADWPGHSSLLQLHFSPEIRADLLWPSAMHVPSLLVAQALASHFPRLLIAVFSSQGHRLFLEESVAFYLHPD